MATKSNSKVLWIIALVVVGFLLANQAGLFSVYLIPKVFITTDFTALVGTEKPLSNLVNDCRSIPGRTAEQVCYINSYIDNIYGYVIFKSPAQLDKNFVSSITRQMESMNQMTKRPYEYRYFNSEQKKLWDKTFGKGIFTAQLISTIKKNKYTSTDAKLITREIDNSLNNWCNGIKAVFSSGKFKNILGNNVNDDMDIWIQICNNKPKKIFDTVDGNVVLKLPNFDVYDYQRYKVNCDSACKNEVCMCQIIELPNTIKTYAGTIKLSQLNLVVKSLGNDFVIGGGTNKGMTMAKSIKRELNFKDYLLQTPFNQGKSIGEGSPFPEYEPGFVIVTSNAQISTMVGDVKDLTK